MKVIIIGGVAGGATAATRLRRLDENAEIIILERSRFVSYANCGLPYYIGGVITEAGELTLQTPESFRERFNIDVRIENEAISINSDKKLVRIRDLKKGEEYEENYDKLLLSPGAKPVKPPIEGADNDRVFTLRTVEDTLTIRAFIEKNNIKTAVMAGGGYIGVEMAENLVHMGIDVTIVQRPNQLMAPFDYDMACQIHGVMMKNGVNLLLERSVEKICSENGYVTAVLNGNKELKADMVIFATGVAPDTVLAKEAGLELGIKGSIMVNERMETSVKDIYAVGDAVEVKHSVTGEKALISLAGPANKQGRIAADNICGGNDVYTGSQGSSVIKIFDMTAANTGINERMAKSLGIDYDKVVLYPLSHAAYYPDARTMVMKVIYERETLKILGAQIIGRDGVDKRIDVIATAIKAGVRADELKDLDLAYAPPYSSAKDPVNMAGFMIENIDTERIKQFHWDEIDCLPRDGSVILLDVRTEFEYRMAHEEGFVNIPVDELRDRVGELERGKTVYVMCHSGLRSYIACRILMQKEFDCYNFSGGYGFLQSIRSGQPHKDRRYLCGMEK